VNAPVREATRATGSAAASAVPASISVAHLSKTFRLPHERYDTLKERVLHPLRSRKFDVLRALDDVSVEIASAEFFGIVGRNGSGKSTLLKCLAGIYDSDSGSIMVGGRLSPFIELGVGFNPELAARDNVIINAIMLGLSRSEARERFDAIVRFAELEEYMDLKLKNYSSGMQVRLAFAVAIQVDADILLIDEVLAVGDAAFQQKCFDEFSRLKAAGRTIVFVTHDMGTVQRFCDRAMLLERGRVVDIGDSESIARQYDDFNFRRTRRTSGGPTAPAVSRSAPPAEIIDARFESASGEEINSLNYREQCQVRVEVQFNRDEQDPLFSIALRNELGHSAFIANSGISHGQTGSFRAGDRAAICIKFENWLGPGRYLLTAAVTPSVFGAEPYDRQDNIAWLRVDSGAAGGGIVDLPHSFEIERQ
jgi:ABC-type polysaccharide/polyol phosphate transport system ATPase subunit